MTGKRRFVMLGRRKDDGADDVEEAMEDTIL